MSIMVIITEELGLITFATGNNYVYFLYPSTHNFEI